MKKITLFVSAILFYSATASELLISDYLKSRVPQGYWQGQSVNRGCSVVVRHDKQVTDDFGINASVFELSIFSKDRQSKTSYKLNDAFMIGGRGDCPQMRTDSLKEIFVVNRPTSAPCFSSYNHTNHGGLQVFVDDNVKIFRIFNEQDDLIGECKITLNH